MSEHTEKTYYSFMLPSNSSFFRTQPCMNANTSINSCASAVCTTSTVPVAERPHVAMLWFIGRLFSDVPSCPAADRLSSRGRFTRPL